jgi:hypothetical protein
MRAIPGFHDLGPFPPQDSLLVIRPTISAAQLQVFDTALICMNQISDGEGYLERTFLSPASIRATAVIISWMKEAGLTTYVFLCSAVVFSHFDLDLPISVQREGGLIKWGIFTVGLSRKILPKRPY